jgi:hypothetical protein
MKLPRIVLLLPLLAGPARAADPASLSATNLAGRLGALQENSSCSIRLRMQVQQPPGTTKATLQIQIKERRTSRGNDVVYQILWPGERKGEAVLLHGMRGRPPVASYFPPHGAPRSVGMNEPLLGGSLAVADAIENFYAWKNQKIVGDEIVNGVPCRILESKPGEGDFSIYGSVRSWVDPRRLVPLRVEKYLSSGQLARRIETTRVARDDNHHDVPANLTVREPRRNSLTELDGSRIRHGEAFTDREFTAEGIGGLTPSRSASP